MTRLIDADSIPWFVEGVGDIPVITKGEIDDMPTVEAVPVRHGIFIGTEYDGYANGCPVYYEWKCSECGTVFEDEEPNYNYCPNCGARMDERKEA